jgi:hypothetical protein
MSPSCTIPWTQVGIKLDCIHWKVFHLTKSADLESMHYFGEREKRKLLPVTELRDTLSLTFKA